MTKLQKLILVRFRSALTTENQATFDTLLEELAGWTFENGEPVLVLADCIMCSNGLSADELLRSENESKLNEYRQSISDRDQKINDLSRENRELAADLVGRDAVIKGLREALEEAEGTAHNLREDLARLTEPDSDFVAKILGTSKWLFSQCGGYLPEFPNDASAAVAVASEAAHNLLLQQKEAIEELKEEMANDGARYQQETAALQHERDGIARELADAKAEIERLRKFEPRMPDDPAPVSSTPPAPKPVEPEPSRTMKRRPERVEDLVKELHVEGKSVEEIVRYIGATPRFREQIQGSPTEYVRSVVDQVIASSRLKEEKGKRERENERLAVPRLLSPEDAFKVIDYAAAGYLPPDISTKTGIPLVDVQAAYFEHQGYIERLGNATKEVSRRTQRDIILRNLREDARRPA